MLSLKIISLWVLAQRIKCNDTNTERLLRISIFSAIALKKPFLTKEIIIINSSQFSKILLIILITGIGNNTIIVLTKWMSDQWFEPAWRFLHLHWQAGEC